MHMTSFGTGSQYWYSFSFAWHFQEKNLLANSTPSPGLCHMVFCMLFSIYRNIYEGQCSGRESQAESGLAGSFLP